LFVYRFNSAKKDNDFIYHDKIPAFDTLPEIKGASLVKGIPFNPNDPEVSGPDIFKKLVPLEAHKASSLYSEEKAKLLRQITTKIEQKNQELRYVHMHVCVILVQHLDWDFVGDRSEGLMPDWWLK